MRRERKEGSGGSDDPSPVARRAAKAVGKGPRTQLTGAQAATDAVAEKGAGAPVDSSVRAPVEAQLGVDLTSARVHSDEGAGQAAEAMSARAFTYGSDVFLGPGESPSDSALMAHELTHVAQQSGGARAAQRQIEVGSQTDPAERQADQVSANAVSGRAGPDAPRVVDDWAVPQAGQIRRSDFMRQLRGDVMSTASDALGPAWSVAGCPYIEAWFARHAETDAASLERMARRYSGVATPGSARDYIPPILARLRGGIERWKNGEDVGGEVAAADGQGGGADQDTAGAARPKLAQAQASEESSPDVAAQLGSGHGLDGATSSRMGEAFGTSFSGVKIHSDASAARLADEHDAQAFTVGDHVAFASGAYRPGDVAGDALIAHELAHVVQQRGADPAVARKRRGGEESGEAHERDADQAATGALARIYGAARAVRDRAQVALTSDYSLQRCSRDQSQRQTQAPPIPSTHGADQRGSQQVPDAAKAHEIAKQLDPSAFQTVPGPAPSGGGHAPPAQVQHVDWDGRTANAAHVANQAALRAALFTGMTAYLTSREASVKQAETQPRVSMAGAGGADKGVQGCAQAAADVLGTRYGASIDAAALTTSQRSARSAPQAASGSGQNLFNPYSVADRQKATGQSDLAFGYGWWMIFNAPECAGGLNSHHLTSHWQDGTEEWTFIEATVNAFAAQGTNRDTMQRHRLYNWSENTSKGVTIQSTYDPKAFGGDAHKAERAARWGVFKTALHELLHFRTHPTFDAANMGRATMQEGFTEMFARDAGNEILPQVSGGSREPLRHQVEGGNDPLDASLVGTWVTATEYAPALQQAEAIRGQIGDQACRAAYFQGHVEYLGLNPDGSPMTNLRAAGTQPQVKIPAGVTNLAGLATASGVSRSAIETANPGITDALPASAVLPGCREHIVVTASDGTGTVVETRAQIAAQNGVSEADLVRANPGIPLNNQNQWTGLAAGNRVLVPVH